MGWRVGSKSRFQGPLTMPGNEVRQDLARPLPIPARELLCSWLLTEVNLPPKEIEDGRKNAEGCAEIAPRKLDPLDKRPSLGIRWTPVMGRSKETGKRGERRSAPRPLWFSAEDSSSSSPNTVRLRMLFRVPSRKYAECTCGRRALG